MHSPERKRSALVVDDSSDSVIPLSILLEDLGWETEIAFDGVEALRKAHYLEPNLVLLDINMPKLDGLGTCYAIKAQPWAKNTHLIAITGDKTKDLLKCTEGVGFDAVLSKPVNFEELSKLITRYAENRKLEGDQSTI